MYRSPLPTIPPPLPPPPPQGWVLHYAVWLSGMLCPPSSRVMESAPCVHWYLACWLVGFWCSGCLVGCCVGWLVVGWLVVAQPSLVGWLVGWLVGSLFGWLLASCWGVCVCIVWTHAVWCCCTVCLCVSMAMQPLQGSLGGLCTVYFGVLAAF